MESTDFSQIKQTLENVEESEMEGKYLTFFSDRQLFGIPIADVLQIVGMQTVTPIPEYPYYAKGVINLRGSIIPVIDIRLRLSKPETEYNDRTCIIVTNVNDSYFGFIVDEVDEVTSIDPEMVSEPPQMAASITEQYLTGIGRLEDKIALLIDTKKLLGEGDLNMLSLAQ